ncbi:MAG: aminotransferase class V-fold PLP-dependent enzyme [Pseudomonadota bacterium]
MPRAVQDAGHDGVRRKGQPWNIGREVRRDINERARAAAASLINASANCVALVPSVSYGFATAAQITPPAPGSRVLVLENDHVSPVLAWEAPAEAAGATLETIATPSDGDWTSAVLEALARTGAPPVSIVSISMVHWSAGAVLDMTRIAEAVRASGGVLAIDATQAVGVIALDVQALDPDFVMFPTYKWLLGPYGRAFFYVAPRHQRGAPIEQTASGRRGVDSEAEVYLRDRRHRDDAARFDMGERDHFITMEMASEGMALIAELGQDTISSYTAALTRPIRERYGDRVAVPDAQAAPHILALDVPPDRSRPICAALAEQHIHVSPRLGRVRVSPHIYNDAEDVERFITAFDAAVRA